LFQVCVVALKVPKNEKPTRQVFRCIANAAAFISATQQRRYVVALKVPKNSGYQAGVYYDTSAPSPFSHHLHYCAGCPTTVVIKQALRCCKDHC
jgi:hypothetical protein